MEKIEILKLESLSREPMVVEGFFFKGSDEKAPKVAIVGAMGGEDLLPLYCASSLVNFLQTKIKKEKILGDVLIIPSINHYALNISERFWPLDKTDINMMFPGYSLGETTQRIASKLFDTIKGYDYGIILETRGDQSTCIPHVQLLKTGWEDVEGAKKFGFQALFRQELKSIDTVTLQYNWQLWQTKAYSVICPNVNQIDKKIADKIDQALLRFMDAKKIVDYHIHKEYETSVFYKKDIAVIKTPESGIFIPLKKPGEYVHKKEVLGEILDALSGESLYTFKSPCDGMVTCLFNHSLIIENAIVFRIAKVR